MGSNDVISFDRAFVRRFWLHVDKLSSDTGCWLWTGQCTDAGYGFCFDGVRTALSHRIAWRIANPMKVLGDAVVRHTCDNPPCVNPAHLETGTIRSNNYDTTARDRGSALATRSAVPDEQDLAERAERAKLNTMIAEELPEPLLETRQGKAARERAFRDRDALVVVLSKVWPSHLMRPPTMNMSFAPNYQWIVCIHSPVGHLGWRICDTAMPQYGHLQAEFDIHETQPLTQEKYDRLAAMPRLWEPEPVAKPQKKGRK